MIAKENKHTINHSEKCIFLPKKGNNLRKREEKQNEKTKKKKNLKSQAKGITLIALVITIIVLLILAGVTIATLTGENGILTKATESKEETEIEGAKENARLDISNWIAEKLENGEDANLSDEIIKGILTRKEYVKTAGDISFISKEGEHEILYSELYTPQNQEDKEEVPIPDGFYHVEDTTIKSDLINSYAWDTAIIYIQKYSGDSRYSKQNSLQDSLANTGKATDGTNFDIKCNIYDMAGNCMEWTTETYTGSTPCVTRGNHYYQPEHGYPPLYTGERYHFGLGDSVTEDVDRLRASFRPILYF